MSVKNKNYVPSYIAENRQIPQAQAGYNALGMSGQKGCANCNWYVAEYNACVIVQGEILPTGLSNMWAEKYEYEQPPVPVVIVGQDITDKSLANRVKSLIGMDTDSVASPFILFKSEDQLRFLCVPTNEFMDRDKDILTSAAHRAFVKQCTVENRYPELWLWHTAGTKCGSVDWLDYDDEGFLCASGVIDKDWEDVVINAVANNQIGMSHGFWPQAYDSEGYITRYLSFEYSILPVAKAANVWTAFNVKEGLGNMALSAEKRKWLADVGIPTTQIDAFEQNNKELSEKLSASGVARKETTEGEPAAPAAPTVQVHDPVGTEIVIDMLKDISDNMKVLGERVLAVEATNKEIHDRVSKDVVDHMEEMYKARVASQPAGFSATKSEENTITPDQAQQQYQVGPGAQQPISFLDEIAGDSLKVIGGVR